MPTNEPTITSVLRMLSIQYDSPIAEQQLLERVLQQRPSSARNPYAPIRERLRADGPRLGWLRLDQTYLVPLHVVLQGLRFRCRPLPWEIAAGMLAAVRLEPFIGLRNPEAVLLDERNQRIAGTTLAAAAGDAWPARDVANEEICFNLGAWFGRVGFAEGDSLICTIIETSPVTLRVQHERAADFRVAAVQQQDQELREAIVERVQATPMLHASSIDLVLPVFARAAWRNGYPGTAWQQLVNDDNRIYMTDHRFVSAPIRRHDYGYADAEPDTTREATIDGLREEIDLLLFDIQRSRQHDAEDGIWDGNLRNAARRADELDLFDADYDPFEVLDNLSSSELELNEDDWDDDPWDLDEDDFQLDDFDGQDLFEANRRMLAALPADVVERLEYARPEEAEVLIAAHLNDLLVREPSLFVPLDLSQSAEPVDDDFSETIAILPDSMSPDEDWEETDAEFELLAMDSSAVYLESSELLRHFYESLIQEGKHRSTAQAHLRNLSVYADYIAQYYSRSLLAGDYATLDEYLFFYYPRRVSGASARRAREFCTSIKQFYAFLQQQGFLSDTRFALAIWRRRDQAARVVELYHRIPLSWPEGEHLRARLLTPYSF
jgi:hypothetical protein